MKYLNIALAKGRLAKQAADIFANTGINTSGLLEDSRKLIITDEENKVRFFLLSCRMFPTTLNTVLRILAYVEETHC